MSRLYIYIWDFAPAFHEFSTDFLQIWHDYRSHLSVPCLNKAPWYLALFLTYGRKTDKIGPLSTGQNLSQLNLDEFSFDKLQTFRIYREKNNLQLSVEKSEISLLDHELWAFKVLIPFISEGVISPFPPNCAVSKVPLDLAEYLT